MRYVGRHKHFPGSPTRDRARDSYLDASQR